MHKLRRLVSKVILLINPGLYKKIKFKQPENISFNTLVKSGLEPELFLIKELHKQRKCCF